MRLFELRSVNPLQLDTWNDLIQNVPECSIFHSREWAEVLTRSYRCKPHYLISQQQDSSFSLLPFMEVQSILKGKIGVSLPFSDIVDPIIPQGVDPHMLFQKTIEFAKNRNWKYLDFHGGNKYFDNATPSKMFYGHRLELSSNINSTFATFSPSAKRTLRKAIKMGLKSHINNSPELLDQFYTLHCVTRKRQKLPVQPYIFFRNIHEHLIAKGMGNIIFASFQDKVIASMVFLHFGNRAFWEFGVSDMKSKHLNPNNLLIWEAVKWYSKHEYKSICFGRTDLLNDGLRQFKNRWGTIEYPFQYFRYDIKNERFLKVNTHRLYMMIRLFFKWMPIRVSKFISNRIYRYFG